MRKQAPFLKIYSEYTNNYKQATALFEECQRKKRSFDEIVRRLEVNIELVCIKFGMKQHILYLYLYDSTSKSFTGATRLRAVLVLSKPKPVLSLPLLSLSGAVPVDRCGDGDGDGDGDCRR